MNPHDIDLISGIAGFAAIGIGLFAPSALRVAGYAVVSGICSLVAFSVAGMPTEMLMRPWVVGQVVSVGVLAFVVYGLRRGIGAAWRWIRRPSSVGSR